MLRASIVQRSFFDRLNLTLYTGLPMAGLTVLAIWLFSGLDDETADLFDDLPEAFEALIGGSAGGNYVVSEIFGLVAPIIVLIVAISAGVGAVAGEEKNRTAGTLLALPVTRRQLVTSKALVLVIQVVLTSALFFAGFAVAVLVFDDSIGVADGGAAIVHLMALGIAFGMIALAISAATGSTMLATTVTAGAAVAANLTAALVPLIDGAGDFARISPWYYYNGSGPLGNGVDLTHIAVLLGIAAAGFAVALVSIGLRDIKSGAQGFPISLAIIEKYSRPRVGSVFSKTVTGGLIVAGVAGYALLGTAVGISFMFDGLEETLSDLSEELPSGFEGLIGDTDMGTPVGWVNAEMLSIMAPIAVIAVAAYAGIGAIAGEQGKRTLGILLSMPISRRRVVLESAAAMVVLTVLVAVVGGVGIWLGSWLADLGLDAGNIAGASLQLAVLGVFFGTVGLALGSLYSSSAAWGGAAGFALLAYIVQGFFPLSDALEPFAELSPWYYYSEAVPLANGIDWAHFGVLAALSVAVIALAAWLVDRREVNG